MGEWKITNSNLFPSQALWIFSLVNYKRPTYHNGHYEYPEWAHALGWTISCVSLVCVPAYALVSIWRAEGETFMDVSNDRNKINKICLTFISSSSLEIQKLDPTEHLRVQDLWRAPLRARLPG